MAQEMATFRDTGFAQAAPGLARMPLLVLTSDDGLAPMSDALVADLKKRGDVRVTAIHQATDHSWSGKRIALEAAVVNWLQALK
jgi:hypothetical protein